ncbi:MAG: hypothetical protein JWM93_6 [Frankiales bacterium]|nr:hypothetical protein [Frankiales bacterium]
MKVPEGWAARQVTGGTLFTDKLNSIQLSSHPATAAPTVATAKSATVGQLQGAEPKFQLRDVTALSRPAGPVVVVHYERDSATNEVTGKVIREEVFRYEFFRAGTEVDVVLSGPTGADNVDPWAIVTDSVKWSA